VDAFQPEGITWLAKDSIFMMPHLGVLAQVHPEAALQVFQRDCLISLGTCVAPRGTGAWGSPAFRYAISGGGLEEEGALSFGEVKRLPLSLGESARIVLEPTRKLDAGAGPGRPLEGELRGGTVGVLLDARGRPLALPDDRQACREAMAQWVRDLELVPPVPA